MQTIVAFFLILSSFLITGCDQSNDHRPPIVEPIVYGKDQLFEPPVPVGNYAVGSTEYYWVDESRGEPHTSNTDDKRELLVRIFYPAESIEQSSKLAVYNYRRWPFWESADNLIPNHRLRRSNYQKSFWPIHIDAPISSTQGFYPLVIFSHGYGFSPEEHVVIGADLASRGFIVASINHPYGASWTVFPDNRIVNAQDLPRGDLGVDLPLWSDDQVFVIDQVERLNSSTDSLVYSKIDLSKIATSGHSYGGAAAYYTAWKDARVSVAIDIDGTIFNPEGKNVSVPFMFMQSGNGDSFEIFDQVANDGYNVAFMQNITHHAFADYPLFWRWDFPEEKPFGPLDGELALKSTVDIMQQFMNKYFEGDEAPLLDNEESYLEYTRVRKFNQGS